MKIHFILAAITILIMNSTKASAVVVEQRVTPAFVSEHPGAFTVRAERQDDGLIKFTITRHLAEPRYLVTSLALRKGSSLVAENHIPSFTRKGNATYHLAVSPEFVSDSSFEISERSFAQSGGQDVPLPGGTDYKIRLADFAPAGIPQGNSGK